MRIGDDNGELRPIAMRAIETCTPVDDIVQVPHAKIWQNNIANSNDGAQILVCVASFCLLPDHDAGRVRVALRDVALTRGLRSDGRKPRPPQPVASMPPSKPVRQA